jgi:RNA polymerase sigma factor (sigma-70 family)
MNREPKRLTEEQKQLAAENYRLVGFVVKNYLRVHPHMAHFEEEFVRAATMQLMKCAGWYEPGLGAAFSTYAIKSMAWTLCNFNKRHRQYSKRYVQIPLQVDNTGRLTEIEFVDPKVPEDNSEEEQAWATLAKFFEPRILQLFQLRICEGLTLEKTAARMGVSKERVRQLQHAATKKLRKRFAEMAKE